MIIHVVRQGETIRSIADLYDRPVERLILENGLSDADNLVIGETIVVLYPEIEYTIEDGDTLESIARSHNTSIMELLRNNPYLSDRQYIHPGEVVVIKYRDKKIRRISTNGYIYPFVNRDILNKTLPFLTYLTVYSYFFNCQGEILEINDADIIEAAKAYGVAPIMMLTGYSSDQREEIEVTNNILINEELQNTLINNLIMLLKRKGYCGVNLKTPYIKPENRISYAQFIKKFSATIQSAGFKVFISIAISVFDTLSNVRYEDLQYKVLGQSADKVIIISYESGFSFGIAPSVIPFDTINNFIEYLSGQIPSEKLVTALSTIGYIWRLPYVGEISVGQSISYNSAIALAREFDAEIHYDEVTKASYFQYTSQYEHIVRFRDARGVDAILSLVPEYNLSGVTIWNVMFFYNQMWLIINSQFEIKKIIPILSGSSYRKAKIQPSKS